MKQEMSKEIVKEISTDRYMKKDGEVIELTFDEYVKYPKNSSLLRLHQLKKISKIRTIKSNKEDE